MDNKPRKKSKILTLLEFSNKFQQEIATLCKVNQSSVSWIRKQYITTGSLSPLRKGKCG